MAFLRLSCTKRKGSKFVTFLTFTSLSFHYTPLSRVYKRASAPLTMLRYFNEKREVNKMLNNEIRPSEKNIPTRNGDYIIDYCEIYDYEIDDESNTVSIFAIVVAHNPKTEITPFVTWEYTAHITDYKIRESFFWGHYFGNEYNARLDYHERLSNYYRLHTVDFKGEA